MKMEGVLQYMNRPKSKQISHLILFPHGQQHMFLFLRVRCKTIFTLSAEFVFSSSLVFDKSSLSVLDLREENFMSASCKLG